MTEESDTSGRDKSLCRLYAPAIESVSRLYGYQTHLLFRIGPFGNDAMLDLAFIVLGAALFLGALLYARGCAGI